MTIFNDQKEQHKWADSESSPESSPESNHTASPVSAAQSEATGKKRASHTRFLFIASTLAVVCVVAFGYLWGVGGLSSASEAGSADSVGAANTANAANSANAINDTSHKSPISGTNVSSPTNETSDTNDANTEVSALSDEQIAELEAAGAIKPDEVLVLLADGTSEQQLQSMLNADERFYGTTIQDMGNTYATLALPADLSIADVLQPLQENALIDLAQPNYIYTVSEDEAGTTPAPSAPSALSAPESASETAATEGVTPISTPPVSDLATALVPNGTFAPQAARDQWALDEVKARDAWASVGQNLSAEARATPVTVAVIDQGFMINHEDLDPHLIAATYDAVGSTTAYPDLDVSGYNDHGTHVLGIVAATSNNAQGVSGVQANNIGIDGITNNWCKVLPIKVADNAGKNMDTEHLVKAYDYLLQRAAAVYNVKVINMSLGGKASGLTAFHDEILYKKIDEARSRGITTVVAAGNSNGSNDPAERLTVPYRAVPGDYDNVVTVINVRQSDNSDRVARDSTSNYNMFGQTTKNISAPGGSIISLSGINAHDYVYKTGTSMASPYVAGIVGLMYSVAPHLTPAQVENVLYSTAKDLKQPPAWAGWDTETGWGLVDAAAAVEKAHTVDPEPTPAHEDDSPTQLTPTPAPDSDSTTQPSPTTQSVPMYRLYNKWTNEHFYTGSANEYQSLIRKGWTDEKVAWYAPESGAPVYRLYNRWSGDHHYTTSRTEYDTCVRQGWRGEGVAFYSGGSTPVYRLFNPYAKTFYHHYTESEAERDACVRRGWDYESIGWYAT